MSTFHAAFAEALFAPEQIRHEQVRALVSQPAFAVYRNTVMKGCIDALEANFPAVARLVGSEWFRAAAAAYVPAHLPTGGCLLAYGDDGFAHFLQALPSAAGLSYLAGVARLDTLWREVHVAAEAPVLDPRALATEAPEALAARVLWPHPATRWAWMPDQPIASIWSRNRASALGENGEIIWQGEGLLLTRDGGSVGWQPLSHAGCAFLDACAEGLPLGNAAQAALGVDPDADLAGVLQLLLQAGAFTSQHPETNGEQP